MASVIEVGGGCLLSGDLEIFRRCLCGSKIVEGRGVFADVMVADDALASAEVASLTAIGLSDSLLFISCFCLMTSASESTLRFFAIRFSRDMVLMRGVN